MSFTTDPATRQAFITGLHDLASYAAWTRRTQRLTTTSPGPAIAVA